MYYLTSIPIYIASIMAILIIFFGSDCIKKIYNSKIYELFDNSYKSALISSLHYNKYIDSIHKNMYKVKLPIIKNINIFKKSYKDSIIDLPEKYIKMLSKYTSEADMITKDYNIFKRYNWKFVMSINNLELNMPFTIDNYIVLPRNKLEFLLSYFEKGNLQKEFIDTLIHEKIHIIQRNNQLKFNRFYKLKYANLLEDIYTSKLPENLDKIYMNNPDSNNTIWIYRFNNKRYIPLLVYENNTLTSKAYNLDFPKDNIKINIMKARLGFKNSISFYHPNEISACIIADDLIHNRLDNAYKKFLKSL